MAASAGATHAALLAIVLLANHLLQRQQYPCVADDSGFGCLGPFLVLAAAWPWQRW
ncbi:MAG TPA: hypothetical protein VI248_28750 [Kineosporiaceae bacterium]